LSTFEYVIQSLNPGYPSLSLKSSPYLTHNHAFNP
jgi:hypothetical protein